MDVSGTELREKVVNVRIHILTRGRGRRRLLHNGCSKPESAW